MSKKEIATLSPEQLETLNASYPVSDDNSRQSYPRFGMLSKDITETQGTGKNKKITIVQSAGTFYTEKDEGEVNEDGNKVWTKTFLGESEDVIIAFHRKQLRLYDNSLEKFISSPIYDTTDQVIPLYLDKRQIAKGTPAQLQSLYPAMSEKGKKISKLKEHTILYILYKGEMYQCNLTISSGWSFSDYKKKINPSTVITTLSSVEETNGSNIYRKMLFKNKRLINGGDEFTAVEEAQSALKSTVDSDKAYFLSQANTQIEGVKDGDAELNEMVNDANKALN
jgi:hypothetical protein